MNDEFLRRLRPMPRAAFVHRLKARLDRLPRTRPIVSAPAYLRTLLIALLIGGAAFAVTMLTMRRPAAVARVSAPHSYSSAPVTESGNVVAPPAAAETKEKELTPVIIHSIRRDPARLEIASARQERPATPERMARDATVATEAQGSQLVAGIVYAGDGARLIKGAGSTFPSQIYTAWSAQYRRVSRALVQYESISSGSSVKLLGTNAVTFAAVDAPVSDVVLKESGAFQFPMVAGGVVPVANLRGVTPSQIALDGPTLARIYLGEISSWNDPSIQKLNPSLTLPGTRITLVYRADVSSSTRVFTDYLSKSSPWFKNRYSITPQIDIAPGAAARSDDGVAEIVERTEGAIGYVDYLYASQHGLESIRLINKEGRVVAASAESVQSALLHADWVGISGFGASLTDLPGERTWPMTRANFIVMQTRTNRLETAGAVLFFDWAYRNGTQSAAELGYVTLPLPLQNRVREMWNVTLGKSVPGG